MLPVLLLLAVLLTTACGSNSEPSSASADLAVALAGPAAVQVGVEATYVVTVSNAGPDPATQVAPRLTLLDGMTPVAGSPVTLAEGVASWPALARLGPSESADFSVTVTAASQASGTLAARASAATGDPEDANNDGSTAASRLAVTVGPAATSADLRMTLGGTLRAASGESVTATLRVENVGPLDASAVVVELQVPEAVGVADLVPADGTREGDVVRWSLGALTTGESRDLSVSLRVPLLSETAVSVTATSATSDGAPANNTAAATLRAIAVAAYTLDGEAAGDNFGWVSENLGDVDGDGVADLALSAPFNDAGGNDAGRAYVYSGAGGTLLYTVTGDVAGSQLGHSISVLGDINGDDVPDIAFGAPGFNTTLPGYALVVSGVDGSTIFRFNGLAPANATGYAVGQAGDITGDGVPDLLVSAPVRNGAAGPAVGAVFVVSGADGTLAAALQGTVPGAVFGAGLRTVGELDGDGVPDFAVGASAEAGGRIHVYSGATGDELYSPLASPTGGGTLGLYWVHSPGDLNADGIPDIFGADINNGTGGANRGQAYVFSGATGAILRTFSGESANDQFGIGRGIGDVTGDGVPDLALAAWRRNEGAPAAGKGYVVDGATGAVRRSFVSVVAGETFGFDIIGLGDVTGDGLTDYVVTAGQEIGPGKAYLIPGVSLETP